VRALERGFGDPVNDWLADPFPGVRDQQIVDSPIGEGEGDSSTISTSSPGLTISP
jgi:hypothetical protein